MTTHDRDKIVALLKSVAAECDHTDEHNWHKCRRCLAAEELDRRDTRILLRGLLEEIDARIFSVWRTVDAQHIAIRAALSAERCDARQPKTGYQCGLTKGHSGAHTALIETRFLHGAKADS